jgi:hypothetical protein
MSFDKLSHAEKEQAARLILAHRKYDDERKREALDKERIPKRRIEEEAAFRRDCPAQAAALDYARRELHIFTSEPTPDELTAVDPEAIALQRKMQEMESLVDDAEKAVKDAQAALTTAQINYRQFAGSAGPRLGAVRTKARLLACRRLFAEATQMTDTVLPRFIAESPTSAKSNCGCRITYQGGHYYLHYLDNSEMGSNTKKMWAPAACHHRICEYHRDVAPIATDELCRLFCDEMKAAGVPVPDHSVHAFNPYK